MKLLTLKRYKFTSVSIEHEDEYNHTYTVAPRIDL